MLNALAHAKAVALQQYVSLGAFAVAVTHNGTCVFLSLDQRPFWSVWENTIFPSFLAPLLGLDAEVSVLRSEVSRRQWCSCFLWVHKLFCFARALLFPPPRLQPCVTVLGLPTQVCCGV